MSSTPCLGDLVCIAPKWYSLLPPVFALILALISKNVILSLSFGILLGTIIYVIVIKGNFFQVFTFFFEVLGERFDVYIVFFTVLLSAAIYNMTKAGGTQAYGAWSKKTIKTRRGAKLSTAILGTIICFDDYFSTIATGTVMRPVADSLLVSREKLSYIVDSTSACFCILQPISTWSAVIISSITTDESSNGMLTFAKTIPYNYYAILTLLTVYFLSITENDFGPMKVYENNTKETGELSYEDNSTVNDEFLDIKASDKGTIWDLLAPIIFLVISTVIMILYLGGAFEGSGKSAEDIFGDTNSSLAMSVSGLLTILFCACLFLPRKLMTFGEFMDGIVGGIKSMVPVIIILTLAWGIGGISKIFQTGEYLGNAVENGNFPTGIIPFIVFIVSGLLSFSIGTAWGTFGILLPITFNICKSTPDILTITQAAVLSGSIFGDHCSPISDTTVMSSLSSRCPHMNHVTTQLPYAILSATSSAFGYLFGGLSRGNAYIGFFTAFFVHILLLTLCIFSSRKGWFSRFERIVKVESSPVITDGLNENNENDEKKSETIVAVIAVNDIVD